MAQSLQNSGCETVSVQNGPDGLKQLQNQRFDLILLDLMLPYKSGDEVLWGEVFAKRDKNLLRIGFYLRAGSFLSTR